MGRSKEYERCLHSLIIMLSPFAPHIAAELWAALRQAPAIQPQLWKKELDVWMQDWPIIDADAAIDFAVLVCEYKLIFCYLTDNEFDIRFYSKKYVKEQKIHRMRILKIAYLCYTPILSMYCS